MLILTGCAAPGVPPASSVPAAGVVMPAVSSPPSWRPGDRWVYGWTSGGRERNQDGRGAGDPRDQWGLLLSRPGRRRGVVLHARPALGGDHARRASDRSNDAPSAVVHLAARRPGRRWTHRGTYEDRNGTTEFNDVFSVVAAEAVEVPAGRFNALKIVRETERRDSDQYWYAPDVRFYVKWIGRRGDTQFEEQLREYHPAPRLIPEQPSTGSPSTK